MMAESVQERLKLKRTALDVWSTKEKLSLASLVLNSGDQNWSCVSRNIRIFAEPNRPPDWFSPKNCAQQYANLLENVETPKRKKRVAGSSEKSEVETPGESIVRKLKTDRIEELKQTMEEIRSEYLKWKEISNSVISGEADNKLQELLQEIEDEKKKKELEKEAHKKWLKEREERKIELERAWKPGSRLMNIRRASSISEPSSEADSPLSEPLNVDVPEESALTKPTPTSPLLTSLLKSPSTASQSVSQNSSSILHSAITSPHRGSSPTIASLLSSSPGLPGNFAMPPSNVSPNLKNLVSNAIGSSLNDEHKVLPQSPSQGAPTLSMLLELPPSLPGKPLPMLKPQPSAPPPYSEHLGPPPPYSQATEYLQKQRAEQMAVQSQGNILKTPPKEEEITPGVTTPTPTSSTDTNHRILTTPPSTGRVQAVTSRRGSLKGRRLDLQSEGEVEETVNAPEATATTPKAFPVKEKETKRILHNTSDHDYVETPVKEKEKSPAKSETKTPKKVETDVFEFDELKEGYDDLRESKMSYLKSNAQRLAMKKEAEVNNQKKNEGIQSPNKNPEPKSYLRESEKGSAVKESSKIMNDEDIPLRDLAKKELLFEEVSDESKKENEPKSAKNSPIKETESKRSSRSSLDGLEKKEPEVSEAKEASPKRKISGDEEKLKPKETSNEKEVEVETETAPEIPEEEIKIEEDYNLQERRKSADLGEKSEEEEKEEDQDDAEVAKDDDASHLTDVKSEKADLSTTEDEKSNDAPPRVYSRRRGAASFSDSVPSSPAPITEEEKEYKAWKKSVMLVYTRLAGHKFASLFLKPITDDQAPNYSTIVKRPMDLSTVKRNIEFGHIRTTAEFQRDVMLMFVNALMYNESDHDVYAMAKEMRADSIEHFQMLQQVTDESTPSRRETRTQQSLEVKVKTTDKSTKVIKTVIEVDKPSTSPEPKTRPNRLSVKNSPAGRPKMVTTNEKQTPASRKRSMAAQGNESGKKRSKVED